MSENTAGSPVYSAAMPADDLIAELRRLSEGKDYMPEDSDELMAIAAERLDDIYSGRCIIVPSSLAHAKGMHLISERYIKDNSPAVTPDKRQD